MSSLIPILRLAAKAVVSAGVNEVLTNAIKSTTPLGLTKTKEMMVKIGTYAITGYVAVKVADYTVQEAEDLISGFFPRKSIPEKKEEEVENPFKGTTSEEIAKFASACTEALKRLEAGKIHATEPF